MTAKEKAIILVNKYDLFQAHVEGFGLENAKECATIAVDEIIKLFKGSITIDFQLSYKYWNEVKIEIQKL